MAVIPQRADEELRLAVVMSGGVSLAVWMGGVALEIDHLRRASAAAFPEGTTGGAPSTGDTPAAVPIAYRQLLELTGSAVRVDVISGTSAGGLNGALLAAAVAYESPLEPLRDVWLTKGSFMELFRKPRDPDPPSLLQGDEYFLKEIRTVVKELRARGSAPSGPPAGSLRLFMTTSLLKGEPRTFRDHFGREIPEITHRGLFRFGHAEFVDEKAAARLARAARSSASHPGGFEASFVQTEEADASDDHPNMDDVVSWAGNRYVVDGGVLLNRPLRPALDAIYEQTPEADVRRTVLLVVPGPGEEGGAEEPSDSRKKSPMLRDTIGSVIRLPLHQSLVEELEDLERRNTRARLQQEARRRLLSIQEGDLVAAATALFLPYRRVRSERDTTVRLGRADPERVGDLSPVETTTDLLASTLQQAVWRRIPEHPPLSEGQEVGGWTALLDPWPWGIRPIEQAATTAVDLLREAVRVFPRDAARTEGAMDLRQELLALKSRGHQALARIRKVAEWEREYWRSMRDDPRLGPPSDDSEFEALARACEEAVDGWREELSRRDAAEPPEWRQDPPITDDPLTELAGMVGLIREAAQPLIDPVASWVRGAYDAFRDSGPEAKREMLASEYVPPESDVLAAVDLAGMTSPGDDVTPPATPEAELTVPAPPDPGQVKSLAEPPPGIVIEVMPPLTAEAKAQAELMAALADLLPAVSSLDGLQRTGQRHPGRAPTDKSQRAASAVAAAVDLWLAQVVALDIVQTAVQAPDSLTEQEINLVQISSDSPNAFNHSLTGAGKLTGFQLMHFGAFYRSSWRANDWMWGRLDGAVEMVQTVLDPTRLAHLGMDRPTLLNRVEEIATGVGETSEVHDFLSRDAATWKAKAFEELEFLDSSGIPPRALPETVLWIARRIQLGILREEIPPLALILAADLEGGAAPRDDSRIFLRETFAAMGLPQDPKTRRAAAQLFETGTEPPPPRPVSPADAERLFKLCKIGGERLQGETESDLFAKTASTAAALAVATTSGERSGLGFLRGLLASLRGITLSFWLMVQAAVAQSRVGFAAITIAVVLASGIIGLGIVELIEAPGLIRWIALLVLGGALILGALRSFSKFPMLAVVLLFLSLLGAILALASEPVLSYLTLVLFFVGAVLLLSLAGRGLRIAARRPLQFGVGALIILVGLALFLLLPFWPPEGGRCGTPVREAAEAGVSFGRPESPTPSPAAAGPNERFRDLCREWAQDWGGRGIVLVGTAMTGAALMTWGRKAKAS